MSGQGAPSTGAEQGDPAPGAAAGAGHLPALHRAAAPAGRRGPLLPPHVRQVVLRGAGQHRAAQGALEQPGPTGSPKIIDIFKFRLRAIKMHQIKF